MEDSPSLALCLLQLPQPLVHHQTDDRDYLGDGEIACPFDENDQSTCRENDDCDYFGDAAKPCMAMTCICINFKMYLYTLQYLFVQIAICICPNSKVCLSKFQNDNCDYFGDGAMYLC